MTDYDPNLPQEFAHAPKRNGFGLVMFIMTMIVVFVLGGLFATLHHSSGKVERTASTQVETDVEAPTPTPE